MPMPRTMPATPVMTSARRSVFCAIPSTACVNTMPAPVSATTPMMMPAQARQLAARHAHDAVALCLEMHRAEAGDVVEDGGNQRPERDLAVGHLQELGHDEGGGAHDGRHDLSAGGRDGLDAGREMGL